MLRQRLSCRRTALPLRTATILATAFVVFSAMDARALAIVPIKTSKMYETYPQSMTVGTRRLFAWSRTATPDTWGRGFDLMLGINGVARQINRPGSRAFPGGFDDVGRLIFQQEFAKTYRNSDLYSWFDGHITKLPAAVNNQRWQYGGDRWGAWLVYGENRFTTKTSPWTIQSYDMVNATKRTVARSTNGCHCVEPGNVVGTLTAYRLSRRIRVSELGDTPAVVAATIPPTGFFDQHPFLVDPTPDQPDSGDETLYWVRQRSGTCGVGVQILTAPLNDLAATAVLFTLHPGMGVTSLSVDDTGGTSDLYFGRASCTKVPKGDVFEIRDV